MMVEYKVINDYMVFYDAIPEKWKQIFLAEYHLYGNNALLQGIYIDGNLSGGGWIGYNPDSFLDNAILSMIDTYYKDNVSKISYFFIIDSCQRQGWGTHYMTHLMDIYKPCFITCVGEYLKKFYKSLGFAIIVSEGDRHLMFYDKTPIL